MKALSIENSMVQAFREQVREYQPTAEGIGLLPEPGGSIENLRRLGRDILAVLNGTHVLVVFKTGETYLTSLPPGPELADLLTELNQGDFVDRDELLRTFATWPTDLEGPLPITGGIGKAPFGQSLP
jgi:hypothetical protein